LTPSNIQGLNPYSPNYVINKKENFQTTKVAHGFDFERKNKINGNDQPQFWAYQGHKRIVFYTIILFYLI
jgi:hypothetical protein